MTGNLLPYPGLSYLPPETPVAWVEVPGGETIWAIVAWSTGDIEGLELDDFSFLAPVPLEIKTDEERTVLNDLPFDVLGETLLMKLTNEGMSLKQARDWLLDRWPHSEIQDGTVSSYLDRWNALYQGGETD